MEGDGKGEKDRKRILTIWTVNPGYRWIDSDSVYSHAPLHSVGQYCYVRY